MKKTFVVKKGDIKRNWLQIDASGQVLGNVASQAVFALLGKNKPTFSPNIDTGDKVVITNAQDIKVTGAKTMNKIYSRHTGFPKGFKTETFEKLLKRKPTLIIRRAIEGMLPKNKLQKDRMKNLFVYEGSHNPHHGQTETNTK